ncbi:Na+/H+-dicarboxylate symporter [Mucilaginibacter frigoritolerans]|uniref:Na+/H+-dicarboxylate symporter n=1 Tax=Mucilaginibacter frigoritolerans TaxID=652788 RepID=A0A562TX35_9SPHI|nr:dicarboxylate/amino acid:cation symporter [Mucilaginibacter frigoritolerans]TWI98189.1 Na+/H+-dicarboxylate symporter [Mucilaginibacter frigoritolerans]
MQKSKLTLFIFIALLLGVIAGYLYNVFVIDEINTKMTHAETQITTINQQLASKNNSAELNAQLNTQKNAQTIIIKKSDEQRGSKLEGFTILSDIFLRLIKMIIAPLVFTTLVVGVAKVGDIKAVGRIGGKTLLWFLGATLVSLLLGMLMVNLFEPGKAINLNLSYTADAGIKKISFSLKDFVEHIFPKSIFEALADNQILQIVVFALFFGIATAAIGEKGQPVIKMMDALSHIILKITSYVMKMAPLAVFGAITTIVAKQGLGIISTYVIFIGEFYLSLIVLWLLIIVAGYFVLNKRVFTLLNHIKDSILLAFSTSTSETAYPKVLMELEQFGCSNKIVSFVLPLGYSFNLDGAMMYMTFASLFLAQAYNVHLALGQQITMLLILMLSSKGVAGVPRAALVIVAGILPQFNIPEAGFALIIGIDPILDMGRSATNVLGNAMATAVVSKWEKELN